MSVRPLSHQERCDAVAEQIVEFVAMTRGVDPQRAVPTCPGWTLAGLIKHMGHVHRWVTQIVEKLPTERLPFPEDQLGLPADPYAYPDWLADGAEALLMTLRAADPDTPVWAWGPDHYVRFWSRRTLHETTVHHFDAAVTVGVEPEIDPAVAADGISEFLVNLPYAALWAPSVAELRGDGEGLRLTAEDVGLSWHVTLRPEGYEWRQETDEQRSGLVSVAGRGAVADLYLLLWGRRDTNDPRFRVEGDTALLEHWVASSAI